MAAATHPIPSDPGLLAEIRRYGRFDTTGCYQCGSCTLSCELVGGTASFPRKSIRYALLGLRAPLLGSLEPWICHDCGDCSIICPRQAEPRISMSTLRRFLNAQYDWSGIAARLSRSGALYLATFFSVALITALLIVFYHLWYVKLAFGDFVSTPLGQEHMFPLMTYYTVIVTLLPLLLLVSRVYRVWRLSMGNGPAIPFSIYRSEAKTYVYQSVTHSLMRKCPERGRWLGHWMLAFGTVLMLTIKTFALRWFQTDRLYPLYNPQRWLGYLAAGFIIYGVVDILVGRIRAKKEIYKQTRAEDMVFPVALLLTALTGLTAHILRYAGFEMGCHFAYALHIVIATPMLVIEMSFGKWSHMLYRPLALYLEAVKARAARTAVREGIAYAS